MAARRASLPLMPWRRNRLSPGVKSPRPAAFSVATVPGAVEASRLVLMMIAMLAARSAANASIAPGAATTALAPVRSQRAHCAASKGAAGSRAANASTPRLRITVSSASNTAARGLPAQAVQLGAASVALGASTTLSPAAFR
ncbi:hypothetical protein WR25_13880 [Diploscapter pachys]|uniref:Uncharacterized protein n=1 Tax=Diploscapter pachys TaxID=2018661 RepID=A0A2A2K0T0_9BILA|nr:hypothetical protein WR25_13880 [Diploscapter pachys]